MTTEPTYINDQAELVDAMAPTHKDAAEWARLYFLRKNPKAVVLADGETVDPYHNERQAKRLNEALKTFIQAHDNEPIIVEGLPPLVLQQATTYQVDVRSLAEHDRATFERLLEHGCLRVDNNALEALEKAGLVTGVPKMSLAGSVRLVFDKRGGVR